jgi:chromosome segregation ATPase
VERLQAEVTRLQQSCADERTTKRQQKESADAASAQLMQSMDGLRQQCSEYQHTEIALRRQLDASDAALRTHLSRESGLLTELQEAAAQRQAAESETSDLRSQLGSAYARTAQLESEVAVRQQQTMERETQLKALQHRASAADAALLQREATAKALQGRLESAIAECEQSRIATVNLTARLERATEASAALQCEVDALTSQCGTLTSELQRVDDTGQSMIRQLEARQHETAKVHQSVISAKEELVHELQRANELQRREHEAMRSAALEREAQAAQVSARLEEVEKQARRDADEYTQQVVELETQLRVLHAQSNEDQRELSHLRHALRAHENDAAQAQHRLLSINGEVEQLKSTLAAAEKRHRDATNELSLARHALTTSTERAEAMERNGADHARTTDLLRAQSEQRAHELAEALSRLATAEASLKEQQWKLDDSELRLSSLHEQCMLERQRSDRLTHECEAYSQQIDVLLGRIHEIQVLKLDSEKKVSELQSEISSLIAQKLADEEAAAQRLTQQERLLQQQRIELVDILKTSKQSWESEVTN